MEKKREDFVLMKITERMILFEENIKSNVDFDGDELDILYLEENTKEFEARKKFLRIIGEMELILGDMYEHSNGMRKIKLFNDLWQIGLFDHMPVDKEHKLCSIQVCYRKFNPFARISCGRRRVSLCIDDDNKLRASLIEWWRPMGSFEYDQEALAIQTEFVKQLNKYGVRREVWR